MRSHANLTHHSDGPVQATATVMGERTDGAVVLVEVRDMGPDRLVARAVATVRPR